MENMDMEMMDTAFISFLLQTLMPIYKKQKTYAINFHAKSGTFLSKIKYIL